ncbi:MAG: hypothetical protein L0H83_04375 [Salinisphaera sp.]|nr:hypothetical protein [Salinisphaera sp.]
MSVGADTQARMRTRVTRVVREHTGFNERLALYIASEIIDALIEDYRGERLYVSASRAERDAAVLIDFNGRNHRAVCARHGVSRSTLYRIIGQRCRRPWPPTA